MNPRIAESKAVLFIVHPLALILSTVVFTDFLRPFDEEDANGFLFAGESEAGLLF